jgi:hypothetical protein
MQDIAILIPIHPPDYHYLYKLLSRLKENEIDIDIFLVFSTNDDYSMFEMKAEIHPIIITTEINKNSIVTFKKFYGLNYLMNSKYDYIICCDSEIDIIPKNFNRENIMEKITNMFNNKIIYAGDLNSRVDISYVNTSCANLFQEEFYELQKKTGNFMYYAWFSDIPVYRRADLQRFFEKIHYTEVTMHLIYEHFDYIIYQYYLMITEGFTIINTSTITGVNWSLEGVYITDNNIGPYKNILDGLSDIKYGFGWAHRILYERNMESIESKGTFMIYHLNA